MFGGAFESEHLYPCPNWALSVRHLHAAFIIVGKKETKHEEGEVSALLLYLLCDLAPEFLAFLSEVTNKSFALCQPVQVRCS